MPSSPPKAGTGDTLNHRPKYRQKPGWASTGAFPGAARTHHDPDFSFPITPDCTCPSPSSAHVPPAAELSLKGQRCPHVEDHRLRLQMLLLAPPRAYTSCSKHGIIENGKCSEIRDGLQRYNLFPTLPDKYNHRQRLECFCAVHKSGQFAFCTVLDKY